jgi:nicotinamidase-related amidase
MAFPYVPAPQVDVPDIPYVDSVSLPAAETALIVVDMQNDFVKEGGSLLVKAAADTVPRIQELLERSRSAGLKIAFTQDTQVKDDPEFDIWPEHCVKGSWGWQIIDELKPRPGELICPKNRYDGFYGTWLDHFLNNIWGVSNTIIAGTVANICVAHTAASAALRWFNIIVPADGVSALTEFDQALTLRQVTSLYAGKATKSTNDILFK